MCLLDLQLDDALLEQQRAAYAVKGVDESEPAQAGKKRKKQIYTNGEDVRTLHNPLNTPSKLTTHFHFLGERRSSHHQEI